jgi:hypothetical protein
MANQQFETHLDNILSSYFDEYCRPLAYLDPRNLSKKSDRNLFHEHNQTTNFYHAVRRHFDDAVIWFELSIGKKLPNTKKGKESTNAIDGIIYIPQCDTLLIIEAKGLRKKSKFIDILNDLNRTLGKSRTPADISSYKLQLRKTQHVYAITLADIWGDKDRAEHSRFQKDWDINFTDSEVTSKAASQAAFSKYAERVNANPNVIWWSSKTFQIAPATPNYRLLAMIYEMSPAEIDTYNFI